MLISQREIEEVGRPGDRENLRGAFLLHPYEKLNCIKLKEYAQMKGEKKNSVDGIKTCNRCLRMIQCLQQTLQKLI